MPVVTGMELSEQDLAGFRELFDLVDKDGSGALEIQIANRATESRRHASFEVRAAATAVSESRDRFVSLTARWRVHSSPRLAFFDALSVPPRPR